MESLRLEKAATAVLVVLSAVGCSTKAEPDPAPDAGSTVVPAALVDDSYERVVDVISRVARCEIYHRGQLLDLGSAASDSRFGYGISPPAEIKEIVREGATWAQVGTRSVSQSFSWDQKTPIFVAARIRGGAARTATVRVDGKAVGNLNFRRGEAEVAATKPTTDMIEPGPHVLTLQFHGIGKNQPYADIDWVRIGIPDEDPSTFAPPTLRDLVVDAVLAGVPQKAIGLRAPGAVRCMVAVQEGMRLRTTTGFLGPGNGEAEVRIAEPGSDPVVVSTTQIGAEKEPVGVVNVSLDAFAGKFVVLDLVAKQATTGGRVLFGEPVVAVRKRSLPPRPNAKIAVVVVLSSADKDHLPPYADVPALASLSDLASSSACFRKHRSTTTVVAGSMASLLTGLPPQDHGVLDNAARLPDRFATIGTYARDGHVTSAMFTANPTTFEAFGFGRGWDKYETFSPVSGVSTRTPLAEATHWIEQRLQDAKDSRLLVVVHSRGGHPPWTATDTEIRSLPPADYLGPIDARRGGQVLTRARGKRPRFRLVPADRERLEAFIRLGLTAEDHQLGALVTYLQKAGVWDSTLFVVTSDVSMGGPSRVPFGDGEKLDEDLLELPLVVHFPEGRFGGKHITVPTTSQDLLSTVLGAFGLQAQDKPKGYDLFEVATHPERFALRPQIATLGNAYATRAGDYVLRGESPKAPVLCDLLAAGPCTSTPPALALVATHLWRETYFTLRESVDPKRLVSREPATLDPDTFAALLVWGNQETKR